MYKVVLIDDEWIIVNGLQKVIAWEAFGCEIAGTAGDGMTGIQLIRDIRPDIVFTDIRMPNMDGLSMLAAIKSEFPHLQVSILTAFRDFEYAQKAIRLGVSRYLLKPSKLEEITEAIRHMAAVCGRLAAETMEPPPGEDAGPAGESEAAVFVVNGALAYIRRHFAERIRLSDVAESVYVSQWHLSKLINRHLHKSFFDVLNEVRVMEAKRLLPDPSLKVHEIADRVGFSDVAHFSKTFKRMVGKSPVEYRATAQR